MQMMMNDADLPFGTSDRFKTSDWSVDRFTKTFFWKFQKCRVVLCYILIDKQMLEKVFCSNITPSLSSRDRLLYKAEYRGQSCPN